MNYNTNKEVYEFYKDYVVLSLIIFLKLISKVKQKIDDCLNLSYLRKKWHEFTLKLCAIVNYSIVRQFSFGLNFNQMRNSGNTIIKFKRVKNQNECKL